MEQQEVKPAEKAWNVGGTLFNATVADWHRAAADDAIATCAEWVYRFSKMGEMNPNTIVNIQLFGSDGRVDEKKYLGYTMQLLMAITKGTQDRVETAGHLKVSEIAMVSAAKLGWIKSKDLVNEKG